MPKLTITSREMKKFRALDPAWYPFKIESINTKPAKTDGSTNYVVRYIGTGPNNDGAEVTEYYNEKTPTRWVPLLSAITKKDIDPEADLDFDYDELVGKSIQIYITNEMYAGTMRNHVGEIGPAEA